MWPAFEVSYNRAWKISLKLMTSKYAFQFKTEVQNDNRIRFNHQYSQQYWPTFQYSFEKEKEAYFQFRVRYLDPIM